jgi:hypothetical protein
MAADYAVVAARDDYCYYYYIASFAANVDANVVDGGADDH